MTNQATGATQKDIGKLVIVNGYPQRGVVRRVMGRTVEVEMPHGIVAADQDKIYVISNAKE